MTRIACIAAVLLTAGCRTVATFEPTDSGGARLTANARCVASLERTPDGAETWHIDTAQQTLLDRIRAGTANMLRYLGRRLDTITPTIGD